MKATSFFLLFLMISFGVSGQSWSWVRGASGDSIRGNAVATDDLGHVYMAGYFDDSISFDGVQQHYSSGSTDGYLAKYNTAGDYMWSVTIGGTSVDHINAVATDSDGNVYVAGAFTGQADFGGISMTASSGDIFVAKYDNLGALVWVRQAGTQYVDVAYAITYDRNGFVLITGILSGTQAGGDVATFDNMQVQTVGGIDVFLAKYSLSGDIEWVKVSGGPSSDLSESVSVDSAGNAYIGGTFGSGSIQFDHLHVASISSGFMSGNMFLAKYDHSGLPLWATTAGGVMMPSTSSGAIRGGYCGADEEGNLYATGSYHSCDMKFDDGTVLESIGDDDIFVAKYNSNGDLAWARRAGWLGYDLGYGAVTTEQSGVAIIGSFNTKAVFDSDTLEAQSQSDIFIVKYDPLGNLIWTASAGGMGFDEAYSITTDKSTADILVTGNCGGNAEFGANQLSGSGKHLFVAKLSLPSNIQHDPLAQAIIVSPNPADQWLSVTWQGNYQAAALNDLTGRQVFGCSLFSNSKQIDISVGSLAAGIYYLELRGKKSVITKKIIIHH